MSGLGVHKRLRYAAVLSCAFAGATVLSHAPAVAQSADDQSPTTIRGSVNETDLNAELLRRRPAGARGAAYDPAAAAKPANTASDPAYTPYLQPDGTSADETRAGAFDPSLKEPEDPFADAEAITAGAPASKRYKDKRDQMLKGPGRAKTPLTAAERRKAKEKELKSRGEASQDPANARTFRAKSSRDEKLDRGSERVGSIEGRPIKREDNPFEAPGIAAGTFTLRPTIETGVVVTSNARSSPEGGESVQSETTLRVNALSEFGGDKTSIEGYGTYRKSISGEETLEKEASLNAEAIRVLDNDYKARGTLSYKISPQSYSAPVEINDVATQPTEQNLQASLGVSKDLGKARVGVAGKVDRQWFGEAELGTGQSISQSDRNSTLATVILRGGYEISPALTPFVEVTGGRRIYDESEDAAGYKRSAGHYAANAGLEIDLGEKLNGDIAAGFVTEDFDDDRLKALAGLNLAANLNWSPERGTIVRLTGTTNLESSTTPGASGSILHQGAVSVERQLRANLTGNVSGRMGYRDYQSSGEHDLILTAEGGVTWWLNRYVGLSSRVKHEIVKSSLANRSYQANSAYLGLKMQR